MSIIYSVVVRQNQNGQQIPLCSYDTAQGNYPSITMNILKKIKIDNKVSYKYSEEYVYHICKEGNLLFVCLVDGSTKIRTAYTFLDDIKKKFLEKYSQEEIASAIAHGLNESFFQIYKQQFSFFNSNKEQDKKQILTLQLQKLYNEQSQNLEKVMKREQKVEMTVRKAENFQSIAQQIHVKSKRMNQEAFWAKNRCKLLIIGAVIAAGTGFFFII